MIAARAFIMRLNLKPFIFFVFCLIVIIYLITIDYALVSETTIRWSWQKKKPAWYDENWCSDDKTRPTGKKVLHFSLFGKARGNWEQDVEHIGSEAMNSFFYRDWILRVYHNETLPTDSVNGLLNQHPNLVFCDTRKTLPRRNVQPSNFLSHLDWQIHMVGDPTLEISCFRNLKSPLLQREMDAMEQWIEKKTFFHVFRDHPQHDKLLNEGLFCLNSRLDRPLSARVATLARRQVGNAKDLEAKVWDIVRHNVTQHDAFRCNSVVYKQGHAPFPSARSRSSEYVGCLRPCNDKHVPTCPVECRPPEHIDWNYC